MERIDFGNSYFTTRKMLPEANNELTGLWGRKLVQNMANTYGLIGTLRLNGDGWHWINLGLTKRFQFPPAMQILYMFDESGTLFQQDDCAYSSFLSIVIH